MRKKLILILLASILYLAILKKEKVIESDFNDEDEIRLETEDFEIENIEITQEEILTETIAKTENVEENKIQEQSQEITTNNKQVVEVPKQKQTQNQEQPKTNNQIVTEKSKQEEQLKQEEPKKEEIKVEEQEEKIVEQEKVNIEEYKINEEMINKIKTIIKNNETEDMKTYGYEIVVDNTIPELTNEFTFTEKRVINKITWSCGIIKIYARDYYFNGQLVSTQCFIL